MDLLSTVRKEGPRGGRGDFKWSDVQTSTHRENYLGHSLMAPVGRWQKNRDLNWYAKADDTIDGGENLADKAARERKEEIRKIKEAEQDALARALGFEVAPRNPNLEALGDKREVDRVLKEAVEEGETDANGGEGVGFGGVSGLGTDQQDNDERMEGNAEKQDAELNYALKEYRRRHGNGERRRRSRSREKNRNREKRHHRHDGRDERHRRRRSRSADEPRRRYPKSRSRSREQSKKVDKRNSRNDRSRSPYSRDRRDDKERRDRSVSRERYRRDERHGLDYNRRR